MTPSGEGGGGGEVPVVAGIILVVTPAARCGFQSRPVCPFCDPVCNVTTRRRFSALRGVFSFFKTLRCRNFLVEYLHTIRYSAQDRVTCTAPKTIKVRATFSFWGDESVFKVNFQLCSIFFNFFLVQSKTYKKVPLLFFWLLKVFHVVQFCIAAPFFLQGNILTYPTFSSIDFII